MIIPAFLTTTNLVLRPLQPSDVDGPYLGWFNDPEVCRYNGHFVFPYQRQQALEYIDTVNAGRGQLVLAMIERASDLHVGNIALANIDWVNRSAEFAIVLGERQTWGRGYSKEAATALLDHAFSALNLNRVHCGTIAENLAMRRLAAFVGMREEGIRRSALFKAGKYVDVVEYGVLQSEYLQHRASV